MTVTRRHFLGTAAATAVSVGFLANATSQEETTEPRAPLRTKLYKSWIIGEPNDEQCAKLKAAGYDGVETTAWNVSAAAARKSRAIAEAHDLRIHSVMRAWTDINKDAETLAHDVETVKDALRAAAGYGADTVLWVPCKVGNMKMPDPWNFDVDFDPATLEVKGVVKDDNAAFADYIAAQNKATKATLEAVEQLIPVAAKEGVRLTAENVWNNLWSTPKYFAALFKYFDNPWFKCYFDLGNQVKYAKCENWLNALGSSIVKLHIKGYNVKEVLGESGGGRGDWSRIDEASVDWKSVRQLLDKIGYSGYVTVEEGKLSPEEYNQLLDKIW